MFIIKLILFITLLITTIQAEQLNIDKFSYFEDVNQSFNINDISKKSFDKTSKPNFSLGKIKGNLWIKLELYNDTQFNNFILSLQEAFYEKANLYTLSNGKWEIQKNSVFTPLKDRVIQSHIISFPISLQQNETKIYYLELNTRFNYFGHIKVSDIFDYAFVEKISNYFFIIIFTLLFFIIFLNLLMFFFLRGKIHFYYAGYSIFSLLFLSMNSGMFSYFGLEKYTFYFSFAGCLFVMFLILLTRELFNTKVTIPVFHKISTFFILWLIFLSIAIAISYRPWNDVLNITAQLSNFLFIYGSLMLIIKGNRLAIIYFFTIVNYMFFLSLLAMMALGFVEYSQLSRYGLFYAIIIEIIFFQILIVRNYYNIQKNNLDNQKKINYLQNITNQELEKKVQQRTQELHDYALEKQVLLKEIHHRVKNNFHTIIGILYIDDKKNNTDKNKNLISRLRAISGLHETLYQNDNVNNIHIKNYIKEIVNNNIISNSKKFTVTYNEIDDATFDFDTANSIGIIVNEFITNSVQHNEIEDLKLKIVLQKTDNKWHLLLRDNGTGIIEKNEKGYGTLLMKQFSSNLFNSEFIFTNKNGLEFSLYFEDKDI